MDNESLDELYEKIEEAPDGAVKIALFEEAIRLADHLNNVDEAFWLRVEYLSACNFYGQVLKSLPAFSWCLARVDEPGSDFCISDILWEYKWICTSLHKTPDVDLKQIMDITDDFKQRLEEEGHTYHSYYFIMLYLYQSINDRENARKAYGNLMKCSRDDMSDCPACVQNGLVEYCLFQGEYDEALRKAAPILSGKMKCAEVPHLTYSALLTAAYRHKDYEKAEEYNRRGYRYIAKNPEFLNVVGNYIVYNAVVNPKKAQQLFEKHLNWFLSPYHLVYSKMLFASACAMLFKNINTGELALRLPANFELYNDKNRYNTKELYDYFYKYAINAAKQFDARNGNDGCVKKFAEIYSFT